MPDVGGGTGGWHPCSVADRPRRRLRADTRRVADLAGQRRARASRLCCPSLNRSHVPKPQRTIIVAHADHRAQITPCGKPFCISDVRSNFTAYAWYESVDEGDTRSRQGSMDLTDIPLPEEIQVFTCGPLPFMRHVRSTLLSRGLPAARIRYEVFGPDLWAAQTASDSGS